MYELIVIWANGDKDIYSYDSIRKAVSAEAGMRMANGEQISWIGIRRA
jgi:hypothetical protein